MRQRLDHAAAVVLRDNDRGGHTVAAPELYPHQWSWDSAFVSVGWASLSVRRALTELASLLAGQWQTGMIPQIVFSAAGGYFPGPERWQTERAIAAPTSPRTSGICQPPVHGLALAAIGAIAHDRGGEDVAAFDEFVADTLNSWLAWHRWLDTVRGTHATGLIEIHHGWESGMDNSPRWDGPYSRIEVGQLAPYQRKDLAHVADPQQRPTNNDYDRYVWLVDQLASVAYDDTAARETVAFRVGDVFVTALHSLSSRLLAQLAAQVDRPDAADEFASMAARAQRAVLASVDPVTGLARDHDHRADMWLASNTLGGFAPLICGADAADYQRLVQLFLGPQWCGHRSLRWPVPPTTAPDSSDFVPVSYWRGPVWPVITWLFSWCLEFHGHGAAAADLRTAGLAQLAAGEFAEYYHPLTGEPLGSKQQSWTAAAALAWQAEQLRYPTPHSAGVPG